MRSRDGNHSFTLAVCSVVFFNSLALSASEYLISYRYLVKNATLFNETLFISKAMKKCQGTPQKSIYLDNPKNKNLRDLLSSYDSEFIEYIHKLGLSIEHKDTTSDYQISSTTILTLKTTCFKVDFNENFAIIAPLK
jgi:hypothetical protein